MADVRKKAHYCHFFSTFSPGGAEIRTCNIINALLPDCRHTIVSLDGNDSCRSMLNGQIDIEVITPSERKGGAGVFFWLYRLIQERKPDLVLTYHWGAVDAIWTSRLARAHNIIHHEDGFNADEAYQQKTRRLWFRRIVFRLAKRIVVPSLKLADLARSSWQLPPEKIAYIPNGIDTQSFYPANGEAASFRKKLGISENEIVIGVVAGLRKEKNIELLISVFMKLVKKYPAKLMIVGDGPERKGLNLLVKNLAIEGSVIFTGHTEAPALYYRLMDIYAISSDTEQMPISLLEAMSTGLPVISTNVGDVKQMVSEKNKDFAVERGDVEAYLNTLKIMLQNPTLRKTLGEDNRKLVGERYTLKEQNRRYIELYEDVLADA